VNKFHMMVINSKSSESAFNLVHVCIQHVSFCEVKWVVLTLQIISVKFWVYKCTVLGNQSKQNHFLWCTLFLCTPNSFLYKLW